MASSYTTNYQLNQWEGTDKVLRTEFNADNAKIDAALKANADAIAAEAAAREAAVSAEAEARQAADAGFGNCKVAYGTYTGTGTYGAQHRNTLTFPFEPKLVIVQSAYSAATDGTSSSTNNKAMMVLVRPVASYVFVNGDFSSSITWSGNTVSWQGVNESFQLNQSGTPYVYVAFG